MYWWWLHFRDFIRLFFNWPLPKISILTSWKQPYLCLFVGCKLTIKSNSIQINYIDWIGYKNQISYVGEYMHNFRLPHRIPQTQTSWRVPWLCWDRCSRTFQLIVWLFVKLLCLVIVSRDAPAECLFGLFGKWIIWCYLLEFIVFVIFWYVVYESVVLTITAGYTSLVSITNIQIHKIV